jgi:hypothetical protein
VLTRNVAWSVFLAALDVHASLQKWQALPPSRFRTSVASVLAYITSQLLHTHVAAEKEADEEPQIIFDLPRPKRDDVISPERAYVNRISELVTRAATPIAPQGYDGYTSNPDKSPSADKSR